MAYGASAHGGSSAQHQQQRIIIGVYVTAWRVTAAASSGVIKIFKRHSSVKAWHRAPWRGAASSEK